MTDSDDFRTTEQFQTFAAKYTKAQFAAGIAGNLHRWRDGFTK